MHFFFTDFFTKREHEDVFFFSAAPIPAIANTLCDSEHALRQRTRFTTANTLCDSNYTCHSEHALVTRYGFLLECRCLLEYNAALILNVFKMLCRMVFRVSKDASRYNMYVK